MIINGASRRARVWWTQHLENTATNERVTMIEWRGLAADTIGGALAEMETVSLGTRCKNYFYQANINPRPDEVLTPVQWEHAVDRLEKNLGYEGLPRFVVEHEKAGRVHRHVVWSRIDPDLMVARSDSLTAAIHERTSRELELEFDLARGKSILTPDRDFVRPERQPEPWEIFRGQESTIDPAQVAGQVRDLYAQADSGRAFAAALDEAGYRLCRGDQRVYCILDQAGDVHSLGRRVGVKAAAFKAFMHDVDLEALPSVAEAKAARSQSREQQRAGERSDGGGAHGANRDAARSTPEEYFDRDAQDQAWHDAIAQAGIDHAQEQDAIRATMDHAMRAMEQARTRTLRLEQQEDRAAVRITDRDARREAYRIDRDLAANLAIKIAQATHLGEVQQLAHDRHMALAQEDGTLYAVTARYQFAYDPMMQQHLQHLFGSQIERLPAVQEAKRQARALERAAEGLREPRPASELGTTAGAIRLAYRLTDTGQAFADALEDRGLILARVTAADLQHWHLRPSKTVAPAPPHEPWMIQTGGAAALSEEHRESAARSYAAWEHKDRDSFDNYVASVQEKWAEEQQPGPSHNRAQPQEGELVVVNPFGTVVRLSQRTTGATRTELTAHLQDIDRAPLLSVTDAQAAMQELREQQREAWRRERQAERRQAYVERRSAQLASHATVQAIGLAYAKSTTGPEWVAALAEHGLTVCRVTEAEAARSKTQRDWLGSTPVYEAGAYLALNEHGQIFRLDGTTIYAPEEQIGTRLAAIDGEKMVSLGQAQEMMAAQRDATPGDRETWRTGVGEAMDTVADAAGMATGLAVSLLGGVVREVSDVFGFLGDFVTGSPQGPPAPPRPLSAPPREQTASERARAFLRSRQPETPTLDPQLESLKPWWHETTPEKRDAIRRLAESQARARERDNERDGLDR